MRSSADHTCCRPCMKRRVVGQQGPVPPPRQLGLRALHWHRGKAPRRETPLGAWEALSLGPASQGTRAGPLGAHLCCLSFRLENLWAWGGGSAAPSPCSSASHAFSCSWSVEKHGEGGTEVTPGLLCSPRVPPGVAEASRRLWGMLCRLLHTCTRDERASPARPAQARTLAPGTRWRSERSAATAPRRLDPSTAGTCSELGLARRRCADVTEATNRDGGQRQCPAGASKPSWKSRCGEGRLQLALNSTALLTCPLSVLPDRSRLAQQKPRLATERRTGQPSLDSGMALVCGYQSQVALSALLLLRSPFFFQEWEPLSELGTGRGGGLPQSNASLLGLVSPGASVPGVTPLVDHVEQIPVQAQPKCSA